MRDLLQYVAQALVEHPDQVEASEDDDGLLLLVADEDLSGMVGPRGQTARALRTVVSACRGPDLEVTSREELEADESGADGDPDED